VPSSDGSPVLAEAAGVLSDQFREHLDRFSSLLGPEVDRLEVRFLAQLTRRRFDRRQRQALARVTAGEAARTLTSGRTLVDFFEQVEYNGRRLAKLNLPPHDIVAALGEYDRLLAPVLRRRIPREAHNFQWVRDQLQFSVILTLTNAYYQVREVETRAFYELFHAELESKNLDEVLGRFLVILCGFCRAEAAHLFLARKGESSWSLKASVGAGTPLPEMPAPSAALLRQLRRPRYLRAGRRSRAPLLDPGWRTRYPFCWSVPMLQNGRVAGLMQFGFSKPYEWLPREQELLTAASERCLMAAEKARLVEDLDERQRQVRELAERMMHVEEAERRRISRELHDQTGQDLLCIRLQMELLEEALPDSQPELKTRLGEARDLTERTILEIRRLVADLSPSVLEKLGLAAAVRHLTNRFQRLFPCRMNLRIGRLGRLQAELEVIVYRIVQECLNNVAKHSAASVVNLSVSSADGILRLYVDDDGIGFPVREALQRQAGFGLAGIRERVTLLGGRFEVVSRPRGSNGSRRKSASVTKIWIDLPIPAQGERDAPRTVEVGAMVRGS